MEAAPALCGRDVAVDFMDMTDDRHPWARSADVRPGVELSIGRHVVVGDEDADPKAARIVAVDADGNVGLEVLAGSVGSRSNLLAPVSAKADFHTPSALLVVTGWARCLLSAVEDGRDDRRTGHVTD